MTATYKEANRSEEHAQSTGPVPNELTAQDGDEWDDEQTSIESSTSTSKISAMDAMTHLMKGNLGAGCLNLPFAFSLTGWLASSLILLLVASQGIYSMMLLTECKQLLRDAGHPVNTFMDVAQVALGSRGHSFVQFFLFVLQFGVCCVFLSLIATNLNAMLPAISFHAWLGFVTVALMVLVCVKTLKHLRWFSAAANVFMITALTTAVISAIAEIHQEDVSLPHKGTANWGSLASFTSTIFFSFEGIGLVLPIENSFAQSTSPQESQHLSERYRAWVLPTAMSIVGVLFWFTGFFSSWGFPDIQSGSITAYLATKYPNSVWYAVVNGLVTLAVFLTFPLQLTPAMEVWEEWDRNPATMVEPGQEGLEGQNEGHSASFQPLEDASSVPNVEGTPTEPVTSSTICPVDPSTWLPSGYTWLFRRFVLVLWCLVVVLSVPDLSLLMSLFGAVGQTGLAAMPCLCHLAMQQQGLAKKHPIRMAVDVFTISFAATVMLFGFLSTLLKL
eukprot:Nitzschia sp. Nitz4//scaffold2_size372955//297116//298718//NITZ4_000459-RA/size372955-snap-gene-0.104-mRNA-1//-1//CDS//3329546886//7177//frame0